MSRVEELLAQAERLVATEPTGGVGVAKAAALLESELRAHQHDLRLVTRLMKYQRQAGRERDAMRIGNEVYRPELDDPAFLYEYGVTLRSAGAWRDAMDVHTRAAARHRDDAEAQFAWAISQSVYGLPAEVIHVVDDLVRKFPENIKYAYGRARVLARLGRLRDAAEQLDRLLAGNPRMTDAQILLAKVQMELRWTDRWRATAKTFLPALPPAMRALWASHLAAASGDIVEAQRQIADAIRLAPGDAEAYSENGRFLLEMHDQTGNAEFAALAEKSLAAAVKLAPDDAVAAGRLLEARVASGARPSCASRPHARGCRPTPRAKSIARLAASSGCPSRRPSTACCARTSSGW